MSEEKTTKDRRTLRFTTCGTQIRKTTKVGGSCRLFASSPLLLRSRRSTQPQLEQAGEPGLPHHNRRMTKSYHHLAFLLVASLGVEGFFNSPSIGHVAGSSKLHMNLDFSACPVNSRESLQRTTDLSLEGIGARKVALLGSTVRRLAKCSPAAFVSQANESQSRSRACVCVNKLQTRSVNACSSCLLFMRLASSLTRELSAIVASKAKVTRRVSMNVPTFAGRCNQQHNTYTNSSSAGDQIVHLRQQLCTSRWYIAFPHVPVEANYLCGRLSRSSLSLGTRVLVESVQSATGENQDFS